eukprot:1276651-Rhodomonas_salina.1
MRFRETGLISDARPSSCQIQSSSNVEQGLPSYRFGNRRWLDPDDRKESSVIQQAWIEMNKSMPPGCTFDECCKCLREALKADFIFPVRRANTNEQTFTIGGLSFELQSSAKGRKRARGSANRSEASAPLFSSFDAGGLLRRSQPYSPAISSATTFFRSSLSSCSSEHGDFFSPAPSSPSLYPLHVEDDPESWPESGASSVTLEPPTILIPSASCFAESRCSQRWRSRSRHEEASGSVWPESSKSFGETLSERESRQALLCIETLSLRLADVAHVPDLSDAAVQKLLAYINAEH